MALTQQEQAELAALEQDTQGLTEQEAKELAELEKETAHSPNYEETPEAPSKPDMMQMVDPRRPGEPALAAAAHAIPGFTTLAAAGGAAQDLFAGKVSNLSDVAESFKQHREEAQNAKKWAMNKYPDAASAGEIGGRVAEIGASLIPGTMAGRAAFAAGSAAVNAAEELNDLRDIFKEGAESAGISLGLEAATHGASKILSSVAKSSTFKSTGILASSAIKKAKETLFNRNITTPDQFVEDVINTKALDGKFLVSPARSLEDVSNQASDLATKYGEDIGDILNHADRMNGGLPSISGDHLYTLLNSRISLARDLTPDNPQDLLEIQRLQAFAANAFQGKQFNFSQLHRLKNSVAKSLNLNKTNQLATKEDKIMQSLVEDIDSTIDDAFKSSSIVNIDPQAGQAVQALYRDSKRQFATMTVIADAARNAANKAGYGILDDMRENFFRNAVIGGIGGGMSSKDGGSMASGALAGIALYNLSRNPRVNAAIAQSFGRVGNALMKNPERYAPFAARIGIASKLGSQEFSEEVANADADITLDASPIERNITDLKTKISHLYRIMDANKLDSSVLKDAMNKADYQTVGSVISDLSNLPSLKSYFAKGMGFEGRVYNDQDRAVLVKGIEANEELSPREKRRLADKVWTDGIIPVLERPVAPPANERRRANIVNKAGGTLEEY